VIVVGLCHGFSFFSFSLRVTMQLMRNLFAVTSGQ
jgi:hypothetical protein